MPTMHGGGVGRFDCNQMTATRSAWSGGQKLSNFYSLQDSQLLTLEFCNEENFLSVQSLQEVEDFLHF